MASIVDDFGPLPSGFGSPGAEVPRGGRRARQHLGGEGQRSDAGSGISTDMGETSRTGRLPSLRSCWLQ